MKQKFVALLIGAAIVLAFSIVIIKDRVQVLTTSDSYNALIIECDSKKTRSHQRRGRSHSGGRSYAPVAVSQEGYKAVGSLWVSSKSLCEGMIGRETTILVNRNNPEKARIHSFFQFWLFPLIILLFIGFGIAVISEKTKLAVGIFAGFFVLAGVATASEFRLFSKAAPPPERPPINAELSLDACIELAMRQEGVVLQSELKTLTCKDRGLTDISRLAQLTALEELDLYLNNIDSIKSLSSLGQLRVLMLDGNRQLESLDGVQNLQQLEKLTVHCAGLNDISAIENLTGLRHLDLSCNKLSDISILKNFKLLDRLDLGDNPGITDISSLANKPLLEGIGLYGTTVGDISPLFESVKMGNVNIGSLGNVPCSQIYEMRARLPASSRVRGPKACKVK